MPGPYPRSMPACILLFCLVLPALLYSCDQKHQHHEKENARIIYGSVPVVVEAPVHVAYHHQFFRDEGLDVTLNINPDGASSLDQLFNGKADIIGVTGTPVVYSSFERDDFRIIGDIKHFNIHFCLGRKDRGVEAPDQLKGKRIAVMFGTSAEFFMDVFFLYHGIDRSEVTLVDMNAPAMVAAIAAEEVDAIFCWEPWVMKAKSALGPDAVVLENENIHIGSWLIVVTKVFADARPDVLVKFLRAVVRAEDHIQAHRAESAKIHSLVSGVEEEISGRLIQRLAYGIALDESLLANLEDQARWLIQSGYAAGKNVPNFLDRIYMDALDEVRPGSVTIIR